MFIDDERHSCSQIRQITFILTLESDTVQYGDHISSLLEYIYWRQGLESAEPFVKCKQVLAISSLQQFLGEKSHRLVVAVGFSSGARILARMFDNSFPACTLKKIF